MTDKTVPRDLAQLIADARKVAIEYYQITGRPLGITGEIGECEAKRLLGLRLAPAREPGFDAIDADNRKLQIKTRAFGGDARRRSQSVGSIKLHHPWDAVLLVLMNGDFEPQAIYEADREAVTCALMKPGGKGRNERGVLAISKFKAIAKQVWPVVNA